ncbi:MAG: HlyD family efflux transporter periplasmic adaptor subunit [Saprospirales bacterium]|nr:MAG: HlyD family efflux transporter periplasmic adaptor subunit [Saprospirales bacterium]
MPEVINNEDFRSRSEIDDLIGRPPGWLLRSGISSVALVAFTLVVMSGFIRYPDKTEAVGILSADQPPIEHYAKTSAVLEAILTEDGGEVKIGDRILFFHNLTNTADLEILKSFLADLSEVELVADYLDLSIPKNLKLGDLQAAYSRLQLNYDAFINDLKQSGVFVRMKTLHQEIKTTAELIAILERDKHYLEREMELVEKDFNRYQSLWKDEVYSDREMEQAKGDYLRFKKQLNAADQNVLQQRLRIHQLETEIQNLTESRTSLIAEHLYRIQEAINGIELAIMQWEETYYLKAEIAGTLSLQVGIVPGAFVNQATPLFTIIPHQKQSNNFVRTQLPSPMLARIEQGSRALIKFDNYPHKEWGMISSYVSHISLIPTPNQEGQMIYELKIALPDQLITTYDKELEYRPHAGVRVDIITEDRSILERIFDQILNLIKNKAL